MALILKRKPGESIKVDGPAVITVISAQKLMIEAPAETKIMRTEIQERNVNDDDSNKAA